MTDADRRLIARHSRGAGRHATLCARPSTSARPRPASTWTRWRSWAAPSRQTAERTARLRTASAARSSWCSATPWRTTPLWPARSTASARPDARHQRRRLRPRRGIPCPAKCARASPLMWSPRRSKRPPSASPAWVSWSRRRPRRRLDTPFGIVDLSLAPTPAVGDSVARILEEMGLEVCGTHGTTAALALLNDAVKKGGVMASSSRGRPFRRVYSRQRG